MRDWPNLMPFAAALSEHPDAAAAVGEVVGSVLDTIGPEPDLAVLFLGASSTGVVDDIAGAVRDLLAPRVLLGCTAGAVVGVSREVEDGPAVSLWAGRLPTAVPFRMTTRAVQGGRAIVGFPPPESIPSDASAAVVLADPFTFPAGEFLDGLREQSGVDLPVVGGLASAARGPGGNRLLLDESHYSDGAVGVIVGGVDLTTVVSQGCRPIGDPMTVTKGEHQVIAELAGRPALERLQSLLAHLPPDELRLVQHGLHVGRVIDEYHKERYERGDFLIRGVLGADRDLGALAVGDDVELGATVQFQVRDADSADEDLRSLVAPHEADAALLFTCNGRGTHLFGQPDHDATVLADLLGTVPLAGMSCAGELGPVGDRNFVHGFTASIALLSDRS